MQRLCACVCLLLLAGCDQATKSPASPTQPAEPAAADSTRVTVFADSNLEAAVRLALVRATGILTDQDLLGLTQLESRARGIADLTGIDTLRNLTALGLAGNQIADLSPLAGLTNLRLLNLADNQVQDLSPLTALARLAYLDLQNNKVSDLSALAGLTHLEELVLDFNPVSDIAPLMGLSALRSVGLVDCPLDQASRAAHAPALQAQGVQVTGAWRQGDGSSTEPGPGENTTAGPRHEMVLVPEGEFTMGSDNPMGDPGYYEKPHTVRLDAFYIDQYEVTNAQYQAFVQTTARAPSSAASDSSLSAPQQPVVGVSWIDAKAYCEWAGERLPTEAEWEKAARGTDGRTYPWGEGIDSTKANYNSNLGRTSAVGTYPAGVSPYGVYDMTGNVWEWTSSVYWKYPYNATDGREDPLNTKLPRVLRGGAWNCPPTYYLRSTYRSGYDPTFRIDALGFRCARDQ
jgi:formylglycine-generating enzyme required for sulfatase activity